MSEEQLDRREVLMQAMEAAEEGTLEPVEEAPAELEVVDEIAEEESPEQYPQYRQSPSELLRSADPHSESEAAVPRRA
jgi:hypothetical protein